MTRKHRTGVRLNETEHTTAKRLCETHGFKTIPQLLRDALIRYENWSGSLEGVKSKLSAANSHNKDLQIQLNELKQQKCKDDNDYVALQESYQELDEQLDDYKGKLVDSLQREVKLEREIKGLEIERDNLQERIDAYSEKVKEYDTYRQQISDRIQEYEVIRETLRDDNQDLRDQLSQLTDNYQQRLKENTRLRKRGLIARILNR